MSPYFRVLRIGLVAGPQAELKLLPFSRMTG